QRQHLKREGWIEWNRDGGGQGGSNAYKLLMDRVWNDEHPAPMRDVLGTEDPARMVRRSRTKSRTSRTDAGQTLTITPGGPSAAGRRSFLRQKWGRQPEPARELVNRQEAVAGWRREQLDTLYDRMEPRRHWSGKDKIAWMRKQTDLMARKLDH